MITLTRLLRAAFLLSLAAVVLLGAAVVLLLTVEFTLPLDEYRDRIAADASQALGAEVRISGSLRLISGRDPGIEVGQLRIKRHLADKQIAVDLELARVRVRWWSLLAREIRVSETTVRGAKICLSTASGAPPAMPVRPTQPDAAWHLAGIDDLHLQNITVGTGADCSQGPLGGNLALLKLSAPDGTALRLAGNGTLGGAAWQANFHTSNLLALLTGQTPVPFEFAADFAGTKLKADGRILLSPLSVESGLLVEASQFQAALRALDAPFKDFGPLAARMHLRADENRLTLRIDEARFAPGAANGELAFDWSGQRPRLRLVAQSEKLDAKALQAWISRSIDADRPATERQTPLLIAGLRASDGEFALAGKRLATGRIDLDDFGVSGSWINGKARATAKARLGKRPLKGSFSADLRGDVLALSAEASASELLLPAGAGIGGTVGGLQARVTARGTLGAALRKSLRADLQAQRATLALPLNGGEPMALSVDAARFEWRAPDLLRATLSGSALGQRFDTRIDGKDLEQLMRGDRLPLQATGTFGSLRFKAGGSVALRAGKALADLDFGVSARSLGALAGGTQALAKLPLEAKGQIALTETDWRIDLATLRLGQTSGRARASGTLPPGAQPLVAEFAFDALNVMEMAPPAATKDKWEQKLLPQLEFRDADISVKAGRVVLPGKNLTQAQASMRTRGGVLEQAPFAFKLDGASIKGNIAADLRPAAAIVSASAEASGLEARHLGAQLAKNGVNLKIGSVRFTVSSTGNRLRELVAGATLRTEATEIQFAMATSGARPALAASLSTSTLSAAPAQPTALSVTGTIADLPMSLEATSAPLATLASLPDAFASPAGSAELSANAKMALGKSLYEGKLSARRAGGRTRIEADIRSPLLRMEDLGARNWGKKAGPAQKTEFNAVRGALRGFDARLGLVAERITSAEKEIGRLNAAATLNAGRLRIGPVELRAPGGTAKALLDADLSAEPVRYRIETSADGFDYGLLLKGIDPASEADGSLSLDARLSGRGKWQTIASTLDGEMKLLLFPRGPHAGFGNLWGGGLLRGLAPKLEGAEGANLNCAVAVFDLKQGIARSASLMIDSTRTRAAGELEIDLARDGALKGMIAPKTKRPELFSSQLPVSIGGTLAAPKVAPASGALGLSMLRLFYFQYAYLFDATTGGNPAADGRDDCAAAYKRGLTDQASAERSSTKQNSK